MNRLARELHLSERIHYTVMKTDTGGICTMRNKVGSLILLSTLLSSSILLAAPKKDAKDAGGFKSLSVYTDAKATSNNFSPAGWMGDLSDLSFTDADTNRPRSGKNGIRIGYKAQGAGGWAGIYWQNPQNNWGTKAKAGLDLTGAKKLVFWARGEKGGEVLSEVKVGGIKGTYPDSDEVAVKNLVLTDQWQSYSVDLSGADLSYVIGGFCVVLARDSNPNGAVIYLDDISFTK